MIDSFKKFTLYNSVPLLEKELSLHQNIILKAPTGSGKSLFFPYFLSENCTGKIIVLEPRRLAALELAKFYSSCLNETVGKTAGYKFRMESKVSPESRIIYQTYGNFLQELLRNEIQVDWILFDEFHERKAEMDLLLAYLSERQQKTAIRLAFLSAKVETDALESFLKTRTLELTERSFPVSVLNTEIKTTLEDEICKALRTLDLNGAKKTTLVFLPGKSEIKRAKEKAQEVFKKNKIYFELYSGISEKERNLIFQNSEESRVVFTTNIAETSLTVPSVTGVIDSGLERIQEWNDKDNASVLKLSKITLQNAVQRTGRAGRLSTGICIRLYSESEEGRLQKNIIPEVLRTDLTSFLLMQFFLEKKLSILNGEHTKLNLLTPLPEKRFQKALETLEQYLFVKENKITDSGVKALSLPLNQVSLINAFLKAKEIPLSFLAFLAVLDSGNEYFSRQKKSSDLEILIQDVLGKNANIPKEIFWTFDKLYHYVKQENLPCSKKNITEIFPGLVELFRENLAIAKDTSFILPNKTVLRLDLKEAKVILAFALLRIVNNQKNELLPAAYLKIPENLLYQNSDTLEYKLLWKEPKKRFIGLEIRKNKDKIISEKELLPGEVSEKIQEKLASLCESYWTVKFQKESLEHLYLNEENKVLLLKMKLAAKYFPDYNLPLWNAEDLELVFSEFVSGIFSLKELSENRYNKILREYFGESMLPWLFKTFPDTVVLKNGKKAKYIYNEDLSVEISARLEDFLDSRGEHFIAENKIRVLYNILAPNFRTIQKTWNLNGFWERTYPEVRKELRGRYPKHPWPEKVEI